MLWAHNIHPLTHRSVSGFPRECWEQQDGMLSRMTHWWLDTSYSTNQWWVSSFLYSKFCGYTRGIVYSGHVINNITQFTVLLCEHFLLKVNLFLQSVDWEMAIGSVVLFEELYGFSLARECSNYHTVAIISHTSKVMLNILQARLQ